MNDAAGLRILRAERAAAATFGGGCLAPVAAHAEPLEQDRMWLRVWIGRPDGGESQPRAARETTPSRSVARSPTQALAAGGRSLLEAART